MAKVLRSMFELELINQSLCPYVFLFFDFLRKQTIFKVHFLYVEIYLRIRTFKFLQLSSNFYRLNDKLDPIYVQKTGSISTLVADEHKGIICKTNVLQINFTKNLKNSFS